MSSRRSAIFVSVRGIVVISSVSVALVFAACERPRTPQHYFVPDGFNGWAYVKYDDPSCPPLEIRDGWQMVRIPASGRTCTSSPYEPGKAKEIWEYERSDGTTRPLDYDGEITLFAIHEPGHFVQFLVGPARGATPDPAPFP